MSLSRGGSEGQYFDVRPGYVYVRGKDGDRFNTQINSVPHFCELAMRALAQSGNLDEEELENCEQALRQRFDYVFREDEKNE